jgi:hypothetical protein
MLRVARAWRHQRRHTRHTTDNAIRATHAQHLPWYGFIRYKKARPVRLRKQLSALRSETPFSARTAQRPDSAASRSVMSHAPQAFLFATLECRTRPAAQSLPQHYSKGTSILYASLGGLAPLGHAFPIHSCSYRGEGRAPNRRILRQGGVSERHERLSQHPALEVGRRLHGARRHMLMRAVVPGVSGNWSNAEWLAQQVHHSA